MDGELIGCRGEDQRIEFDLDNGDLAAQHVGKLRFQSGFKYGGNDPETDNHIDQKQSQGNQSDFFKPSCA